LMLIELQLALSLFASATAYEGPPPAMSRLKPRVAEPVPKPGKASVDTQIRPLIDT